MMKLSNSDDVRRLNPVPFAIRSEEDIRHRYSQRARGWRFVSEALKYLLRPAVYALRTLVFRGRYRVPTGRIVFFCTSKNHVTALSPIVGELESPSVFVAPDTGRLADVSLLPLAPAMLVGLLHVPHLIRQWLSAQTSRERMVIRYYYRQLLLSMGFHALAPRYVSRMAPRGLVIASDHDPLARSVVEAAREAGIPTFYVQHAAVTEHFPVNFADHNLLEGEDAREKYMRAGSDADGIQLIGIPRLDAFIAAIRPAQPLQRLGICTNPLSHADDAERLVERIAARYPEVSITLRPHPREPIGTYRATAHRLSVGLSDPAAELAGSFLVEQDVVIAGSSGILLEAAVLNVQPLYYTGFERNAGIDPDYYGFLEHGIAERVTSEEALLEALGGLRASRSTIRHRARRYCATIGTADDGRAAAIAAGIIDSEIRRQQSGASTDAQQPSQTQ